MHIIRVYLERQARRSVYSRTSLLTTQRGPTHRLGESERPTGAGGRELRGPPPLAASNHRPPQSLAAFSRARLGSCSPEASLRLLF